MSNFIFKLRYVRWWKKALATNPANKPWGRKDAKLFYEWACCWIDIGANTPGVIMLCTTPEECAAEDASNA